MNDVTIKIPAERVELVMAALFSHSVGLSNQVEAERVLFGSNDIAFMTRAKEAERFLLETYDVIGEAAHQAQG